MPRRRSRNPTRPSPPRPARLLLRVLLLAWVCFGTTNSEALQNYATKKYVAVNENNTAIVNETPVVFELVRPGNTNATNTGSIMSSKKPEWYLRHFEHRVRLDPPANTDMWLNDSTFNEHPDTFFDGFTAFQSVNYPGYYISVNDRQELHIRRFENTALFHESASFVAGMIHAIREGSLQE